MTWWTRRTEWQVTPTSFRVSVPGGTCIYAYAYFDLGDKVWVADDAFTLRGKEEALMGSAGEIPPRVKKMLAKTLTERYLKDHPLDPLNPEYDEYDQAEDCESAEVPRGQKLFSFQDSCSNATPHPVCRDPFWRWSGAVR